MPALVRLKLLKDLELFYDAVSPLTVTLLTDMTGSTTQGGLTVSTVLTFPATSGRQTYTLGLDGIYCTIIDIKIASIGRVLLFGGVLRVLDVPVYFQGANGEFYDTLPMGIGIGS